MKKWRRSGGGGSASSVVAGPILSTVAEELLQADGCGPYVDNSYIYVEVSDDGVSGWTFNQETPITEDPMPLDLAGAGGKYARAAFTHGDTVPFSEWSNIVLVPI